MKPMYSSNWFETFAKTVPASITSAEVGGISALLPLDQFPRVLDVGCGIGRVSGPLSVLGYAITGIDVSLQALRDGRLRSPSVCFLALDQRHAGRMRWTFDAALVLWNSLGFVNRDADRETLSGLAQAVRPGGKVLLDLYQIKQLLFCKSG